MRMSEKYCNNKHNNNNSDNPLTSRRTYEGKNQSDSLFGDQKNSSNKYLIEKHSRFVTHLRLYSCRRKLEMCCKYFSTLFFQLFHISIQVGGQNCAKKSHAHAREFTQTLLLT